MVEESGSSNGSAQSTTNSPPQAFRLLEVNLLFAADALLCESYSRKANPRFFHLGLSADPYTITSTNPSTRGEKKKKKNQNENFKAAKWIQAAFLHTNENLMKFYKIQLILLKQQ